MTLAIYGKKTSGVIEIRVVAYCREYVENLTLIGCGITNSIGRQDGQLQRLCNADRGLIAPLFLAFIVALNFDIDIVWAEGSSQPLYRLPACLLATACQSGGEWTFIATRQADQPRRVLLQVLPCGGALSLHRLPHLELRDELTEVLIAGLRLAEQRQMSRLWDMLVWQPCGRREARAEAGDGNLCSYMRGDSVSFCAGMKARGAVDAVSVEKSHPWHLEFYGSLDQFLGLGCPFEKAEGAGGMKLYIALSHRGRPSSRNLASGHGAGSSTTMYRHALAQPDPIAEDSIQSCSTNHRC